MYNIVVKTKNISQKGAAMDNHNTNPSDIQQNNKGT